MSAFFQRVRTVFKGWKTVIFHGAYGLPATLFFLYQEFKAAGVDFTVFVPAKYAALTLGIIAVVGVLLRLITTGPISSKEGLPTSSDAFNSKEPL